MRDGVTVPTTLQEYCITSKPKPDIHDDFYMDEDYPDDIDDEMDDSYEEDDDDSGNGETW